MSDQPPRWGLEWSPEQQTYLLTDRHKHVIFAHVNEDYGAGVWATLNACSPGGVLERARDYMQDELSSYVEANCNGDYDEEIARLQKLLADIDAVLTPEKRDDSAE